MCRRKSCGYKMVLWRVEGIKDMIWNDTSTGEGGEEDERGKKNRGMGGIDYTSQSRFVHV